MLNNIPHLITDRDNKELPKWPELEEIKKIIFELRGSSAADPDGFTGLVFQ